MARLTEKDPYWAGEEFWVSACEPDEETIDEVYMKLKEYEDIAEEPEELQKVKRGKWVVVDEDYGCEGGCPWEDIECSRCKTVIGVDTDDRPDYCQYCGSDNREVENDGE